MKKQGEKNAQTTKIAWRTLGVLEGKPPGSEDIMNIFRHLFQRAVYTETWFIAFYVFKME